MKACRNALAPLAQSDSDVPTRLAVRFQAIGGVLIMDRRTHSPQLRKSNEMRRLRAMRGPDAGNDTRTAGALLPRGERAREQDADLGAEAALFALGEFPDLPQQVRTDRDADAFTHRGSL